MVVSTPYAATWFRKQQRAQQSGDGSPRQLYISRANRDISSSLFGLKMGRNLQTALAMVDPARKRDISDRSPFQPRSLKTIFYSSDISLTDGAVHHEIIQHWMINWRWDRYYLLTAFKIITNMISPNIRWIIKINSCHHDVFIKHGNDLLIIWLHVEFWYNVFMSKHYVAA